MKNRVFEYLKETRNEAFAKLFIGLYKTIPEKIVLIVSDINDDKILKAYRENGIRFSKKMFTIDWNKIDFDTNGLSEHMIIFDNQENLHLFKLFYLDICIVTINIPEIIQELKEKRLM